MIVALLLLAQAASLEGAECDDIMRQTSMTRCAWEDFQTADAELNRVWRRALDRSRALSRDNPQQGVTTYEAALLKGQRAWLAYRDAQCAIEGQEMRGGTGEPMLVGQCKAQMTRERTAFLRRVNS